jgi:hypothetical protein
MGKINDAEPRPADQLILLIQERKLFAEGTRTWINLQSKIDEIVAQNYLHYVNR